MKSENQNEGWRRSKSDRLILGVAAGTAEYLKVEPFFIRLLFVILAISGGSGLLIYLLMAVIMPDESEEGAELGRERIGKVAEEISGKARDMGIGMGRKRGKSNKNWRLWIGLLIVLWGFSSLLAVLFPFLWRSELTGPMILIGIGLLLVLKG